MVVANFKNENGWVKSFTSGGVKIYTRSGKLWDSINRRCTSDIFQKQNPSYIGCLNNFKNFNSFVEWCNREQGFMNKESNGRFWAIDKDLLKIGNYSEDSCLFVPSEVNSFIIDRANFRGTEKLGVLFYRNKNMYRARCSSQGKSNHLGYFETEDEAHQAWLNFKRKEAGRLAEKYSIYTKMANALLTYYDDWPNMPYNENK